MQTLKAYISLTKPGIIRGNLLTASAGFLLAAQGNVDTKLLIFSLTGIALIIAAACVINNYIDRNIDQKMARTKDRALVNGTIKPRPAIIYATSLGLVGLIVLAVYTNWLTVGLGLLAVFSYLVLYGIAKRRSIHGTLVGSLPGALPPVAGYTAVSNQLDGGALLLCLILIYWQMAHFYAIAIYRLKDYAAAGIPVLPAVKGLLQTKQQILFYIINFTLANILLVVFGYASLIYLLLTVLLGLTWLKLAIDGFQTKDDVRWARQMFMVSLLVITAVCVLIGADSFLA